MALKKDVLIQASGISKRYRRGRETVTALSDASLVVYRGELLAIVGPSGSGKTTLTHILGGLDTPQEGTVVVDEKPLEKRGDKALSYFRNRSVGFVFQNFSLIPHYTAVENVAMPLVVAGISPKKRREQAVKYLKLVGLSGKENQHASELSGGQRQRVSIARALVNHPQIIIADEPTGSLDSKRGSEIMAIFETLSRKHGITVLMVTHDESLAARADRTVQIRDGKIVSEKSHAEL